MPDREAAFAEEAGDDPAGRVSFSDDGRILRANATLTAWLGRSPAELDEATFDLLLTPGSRIFFQTHFFPLLKLRGRVEEIYLSLRHGSGEDVPVLVNAVRRERCGAATNDCVVLRTRQRDRFEGEILLAKKAAEAASDAKSRFLSVMSHELRTPLQSIAVFGELLRGHGPLTEQQSEDVRGIQTATQHFATLIDDILNYARVESGKVEVRVETVSLGAAVARAESLLRPRFGEAGVRFSSDPRALSTDVRGDPDRLQQILLNLMTNAIKFTPEGGAIRVDVESAGPRVEIHVRDTGFGIPPDQLERIFEPFVQLDRTRLPASRRGVGLGLAISRELARAMGGDLSVRSRVGEGSVFTIALPAAGFVSPEASPQV